VTGIIVDSLPWTLFVIVVALFISYVVAILLGAFMAYYQGSRFDSVGSVLSIFFNSIPYYVVAVIALWFLSYQQGIFPTGGRVNDTYQAAFSVKYVGSILRHATLPILSFALTTFGIRALAMRGNSIRVLGEGYLRVARLRGLPKRRIGVMYVARNAILPMYTEIMISIGFLLGGSIILEQLFRYPGIGYYMFQAIQTRDYPLMMGCFMVIILMVITGVLIADLTYGKLDPRASGGGQRESF
jgi:peptide/nickel transport system permease protein